MEFKITKDQIIFVIVIVFIFICIQVYIQNLRGHLRLNDYRGLNIEFNQSKDLDQ